MTHSLTKTGNIVPVGHASSDVLAFFFAFFFFFIVIAFSPESVVNIQKVGWRGGGPL